MVETKAFYGCCGIVTMFMGGYIGLSLKEYEEAIEEVRLHTGGGKALLFAVTDSQRGQGVPADWLTDSEKEDVARMDAFIAQKDVRLISRHRNGPNGNYINTYIIDSPTSEDV